MPVACSISSRWSCGCSSGADDRPGDSSANGSSRNDSGACEAARRDSDGAAIGSTGAGAGTGAGACAGRSVGGRRAGSSSDDGAAGPATGAAAGAQEGAGNGDAFPFDSGRGSGVPACPAPGSCAPARFSTANAGLFTVSASPEHCSDRGARSSADWGGTLPVVALASSRSAGCAPTAEGRTLSADGSSANRLVRPIPVHRSWWPVALPGDGADWSPATAPFVASAVIGLPKDRPRSPCLPASPGATGSPSCLVWPAES